MVRADHGLAIAAHFAAHHRSPMGASIHQRMELALRIAGDEDGGLADEVGAEIARVPELRFETEIIPRRSAEQNLLFAGVKLGIGENAIRDAGRIDRRMPVALRAL